MESKARCVLELRKDRHDSTLRHLILLKGNYQKEDVKNKSFVLKFDENMLFTNTMQTVDIEELGGGRNINNYKEMRERAFALRKEKKGCREIAAIIGEEFKTTVGKTTVANWINDSKAESHVQAEAGSTVKEE